MSPFHIINQGDTQVFAWVFCQIVDHRIAYGPIPLQQVWRPIGEPMDFNIPTYHVMHVCNDLRTPNRLNRFRSVEANWLQGFQFRVNCGKWKLRNQRAMTFKTANQRFVMTPDMLPHRTVQKAVFPWIYGFTVGAFVILFILFGQPFGFLICKLEATTNFFQQRCPLLRVEFGKNICGLSVANVRHVTVCQAVHCECIMTSRSCHAFANCSAKN